MSYSLFRFLVAIVVWCALAFAPLQSVVAEDKFPTASVADDRYSFGEVPEGAVVKHTFSVKNTGKSLLHLHKVIPTCGCTVSKADPELVPPGEASSVAVQIDTTGFAGDISKKIRVLTNDVDHETLTFTVHGRVIPDITISEPRLHFGVVTRGDSPQEEVTLTIREGSTHSIEKVESFNPAITIVPGELDTKKKRVVKVQIAPTAPLGELRDRVIVTINTGKRMRTINIPVYAQVTGDFTLSTNTVSFGIFANDKPVTRTVLVEASSGKTINTIEISSESAMVKARVAPLEQGRRYQVILEAHPQLRGNLASLRSLVTVTTDLGTSAITIYGVFPPEAR
jgi:hypothetical protein